MLPLSTAYMAALLLWPVVGVSRPMPEGFLTNPELTLYALAFFSACIGYWEVVAGLFVLNKQNLAPRLEILGWSLYLSLFVTSCLLCRRLHVGLINIDNLSSATWAWAGLPVALVGTFLILRSRVENTSQKPALLAYPQYLGLLLILAAMSIAHWAWFPLLALPGVLVVEAWYIKRKQDRNNAIVEANGPQARFKIVPFIY